MNEEFVFVLTHQYPDKSGFSVCGVTMNEAVANAWAIGGRGENKIYRCTPDDIADWTTGHEVWL